MLQTTKFGIRMVALIGALALAGGVGNALAQDATARTLRAAFAQSAPAAEIDSATFIRTYPLALVYRGLAQFAAKDYQGAIESWQEYLARAGGDVDTASVNDLIREAWIREYPLSLVYEGIGRYVGKDVAGAVTAWSRYIELAPDGDTTAVRSLINDALVPRADLASIEISVARFLKDELPQIIAALDIRNRLLLAEKTK
ncbi:MAG: hypothetical protein HY700_02010 [Gemmatimonadetes bacterium]|nr:hypothetical protein [Gemmatimonadota bacterium]